MSERKKTLWDMKQQSLSEARQFLEQVDTEDREWTDEDQTRYDKFMEDHDRFLEAYTREADLEERESAGVEERAAFVPGAPIEKEPTVEERLFEAVKDGNRPHTFDLNCERRTDYPLTTSDSSTTYSSYAVPTLVAPYVEDLKYAYSAVLQAGANVITTEGINTMYIPKVSTAPTINLGSENTAPTNSSYPVLGRTQLDGYRCDAFAVITEEDIASASVDMMGFLNQTLAGALAAKVASYLAVGTGSSQPKGIFIAATTGKTAASSTTFTGDEVIEAYQSISAQYRPGLRAVISQSGESLLSRLKDGNSNYIWRQGLAAGNPDTIQGVPLYVDSQGPALTTGLKPLVFYNPMNFHVRNAMGGKLFYDVSTEAQFTQFNRVIRIAQWMDSDAGDSGGCKSLTLA